MYLSATFAPLALVLAAVGVYGLMSYTVVQRTRELGVRMAMGARSGHVAQLVVGQSLRWTGSGMAVGLLAGWAVSRSLSGFLYGVAPADPLTFAGVTLLLTAVTAAHVPTRRATRVDPLVALRYE